MHVTTTPLLHQCAPKPKGDRAHHNGTSFSKISPPQPREPLRNPSPSPLRSLTATPQTDLRSPACPAWRRRRTASPRILCSSPLCPTTMTASLLTARQQTRTRTHRSAAAPGGPVASPRTCHIQAHTKQPHRLARAGDDPVCRTMRRPQERQTCKGRPLPVQEHGTKHKCWHH
jgi:hypothetical protein